VPDFIVCAKSQVKKIVKKFAATHLLSTLDPGDWVFRPPRIDGQNHLQLWFDDEEDSCKANAPTIQHAKIILEWGSKLPEDARVVVHCFAGACRSTAIAMALWLQHNGTNDLQGAAKWIKEIRSQACPNLLLAQHFDILLGHGGQFVSLCNDVGINTINRRWKINNP
jgi:predicted protein tyrosine phosphatase